jgi:hypothetical protein
MWLIKNFNIINIAPAMSPPKDPALVIGIEHAKEICKVGAGGGKCCRYLTMGSGGFECARLDKEMEKLIDERADSGNMNAISRNCDGFGR